MKYSTRVIERIRLNFSEEFTDHLLSKSDKYDNETQFSISSILPNQQTLLQRYWNLQCISNP